MIANQYDKKFGKCAIFLGPPSQIGWTHRRDFHEGVKVSTFCAVVFQGIVSDYLVPWVEITKV